MKKCTINLHAPTGKSSLMPNTSQKCQAASPIYTHAECVVQNVNVRHPSTTICNHSNYPQWFENHSCWIEADNTHNVHSELSHKMQIICITATIAVASTINECRTTQIKSCKYSRYEGIVYRSKVWGQCDFFKEIIF